MKTRINAFQTSRRLERLSNKWNSMMRSSKNAPEWLYFLAKHFGEEQKFNTHHGVVEVRQFFGVQYLIYK